jgi:hypothetical protein
MTTNPASTKQIDFIKSLFSDAEKGCALAAEQGNDVVLAAVTPKVAAVQDTIVAILGGQPVDKRDASQVISNLKAVADVLRPLVNAATLPAGLVRFSPTRVIPNRFAKACTVCGDTVDTAAGFAAATSRGWLTFCSGCANQSDEDRRAAEEAERAERLAKAEAERAERMAALEAERARRAYIEAFATDLFDRAGESGAARPDLHVAIPSATGNNDLDFFRVVRDHNVTTVYRVIGGHNDQRLALAQAESALWALVLTDDISEALATYGREIGRCGVCHRHLTDEDSRARGIGPNCASRF